jgi:hypothetical protein
LSLINIKTVDFLPDSMFYLILQVVSLLSVGLKKNFTLPPPLFPQNGLVPVL